MSALAYMIIRQEARALSLMKERIQEENRLRMHSSQEHVSDYLEEVYSILLFISQNEDVIAMHREARGFIQKLYDHGWENHQLTEIYVLEQGFSGGQRPFMTFERETENLAGIHAASREQEEYRAQMDHLERFAAQPAWRALLSREIALCVPDSEGRMSRGFVYSVPIRAGDRLAGIVAGMVRTRTLLEHLHQGLDRQTAFLVSERGDLILDPKADPQLAPWFRQRFESQGVTAFFEHTHPGLMVGKWKALWMPAKILSGQRWWMVFLYPVDESSPRSALAGIYFYGALPGSVLFAGIALALLVQMLNKRLAEQGRHLHERKLLERQVQSVSEREQRRIGESLREDLCQRLTGLEAMNRVLNKQLSAKNLPEAQIASDVGQELRDSLTRARQMAEELQPVSLLEAGLLAAVRELASRVEQRGHLSCVVEDVGWPEEVEPSVATHFYRIIQEALANVIAHARASHVTVSLSAQGGLLTLTVSDDGVGLPEGAAEGAGMGLRIMRYRSDLLDGDLRIESAPGKETRVVCTCPNRVPTDHLGGADERVGDP